jgi:transposase
MTSKRRAHTPEFKAEAVKLVLKNGLSRAQASRDLGVSESVLGRWVQRAKEAIDPPDGLTGQEREELKQLRRENSVLRMEREILKKAAAFFARETL